MARSLTTDQLAILSVLREDFEDAYGLGIISHIEKQTGKKINLGSLYNMLKSLESAKLVKSAWGESTEIRRGNRRRYYKITDLGREVCQTEENTLRVLWNPTGA